MCPIDERAEEEGSVVPLQLAIIGFSAITVVYKIAVTFAVTLRWRRVTIGTSSKYNHALCILA